MNGIIHTYFEPRKFGFIVVDSGHKYFFHESNFKSGTPELGARVEFSLGAPSSLGKPPQAINITVTEPPVERFDFADAFSNVSKAAQS